MIWLLFVAYVATIFAANWAVATFGIVSIGPFAAPAAVFFVGFAFPLRDGIQKLSNRWVSIGAILVGTALSYLVSPHFAFASGVTFLVSEGCDMWVYTWLQRKFLIAVGTSSALSLVVDSILFLTLAFGSLTFLPGQIIGKAISVAISLGVIGLWRARAFLPRYTPA
jgi:hypothetical protein